MRLRRSAWLIAALMAAPLAAQEITAPPRAPEVWLVTMGPGQTVYERYGHNAIWIRDTVAGTDLVYNYGTFDFGQTTADVARFVGRFAMGRPQYWLGTMSMAQTIATYTFHQRDVDVQELALPAAARIELAQLLADNARPEHRVYTYDYFLDNCSTRIRDILNRVTQGALEAATVGVPSEGSFRFHTHRSLTNDPLMYMGILLALGPPADVSVDQWHEMFLPAKLQERVRELRVPDASGRDVPMVTRELRLLEIGVYRVEPLPPVWGGWLLLIGVAIALAILTGRAEGRTGTLGRVVATAWALVAGIAGVALLVLWLATNHVAAAWNHNILLVSPLVLGLIGAIWSAERREPGRWAARLAVATLVSVGIGALLALIPSIGGQWNLQVAALVAPPTVAVSLLTLRRD